VPQAGWTGEHDWKGFVPFEDMPHVLNPEKGYVITANHKVEPDDFPYFLGDIYMNGYRANRLEKMLLRKDKQTPKILQKCKWIFIVFPGNYLLHTTKPYKRAILNCNVILDMLLAWDGVLDPDKN
jgi:penicillin amidase